MIKAEIRRNLLPRFQKPIVMNFRELDIVSEEEAEDFLYNGSSDAIEMLGDTVVGPKESETIAVLVHGFTGSNLENLYLANKLAQAGIRVYLPLLPGHGTDYEDLKTKGADEWIAKVIDVLKVVRQAHPSSRLVVMGHSLGGPIAITALFKSGLQVDGAVILASPFRYSSLLRWRIKLFGWLPLKIPFAGFKFTDKKLYHNALVGYFDSKYEYIYMKSARDAFTVMDKAYEILPRIKIPVLLVYSRIDYRVPFNQVDLVRRRIPHAELRAFEKGDHVLQIDSDRKEVAESIIDWINGLGKKREPY